MTVQDENRKLGGDEADAIGVVNPDHAPKLLEGEAVDRVMAVLNYWFDGRYKVSRESEMVAQLAALVAPPIEAGLREKVERAFDLLNRIRWVREFYTDGDFVATVRKPDILPAADALLEALSALQSEGVGG